ncbi:hypothetical protein HDR63_00015 [bacterium]|nr:hypothetical protein [bacterium]
MRHESGRSLIEVIGVLAIAAIMTSLAITMFSTIRHRQIRTVAAADLAQVVKNVRLLMGARGDYTGLSVDYLVKAGALRNTHAPIGNAWTVTSGTDRQTFVITLMGLSEGECDFFVAAPPTWASLLRVNGADVVDGETVYCLTSPNNQIAFVAE